MKELKFFVIKTNLTLPLTEGPPVSSVSLTGGRQTEKIGTAKKILPVLTIFFQGKDFVAAGRKFARLHGVQNLLSIFDRTRNIYQGPCL